MTLHPYLHGRGFTEKTATELQWTVRRLGPDARIYALRQGTEVWCIPYLLAGQALFERVRLISDDDIARHGGDRYRQPKGHALRPYDPDGHLHGGRLQQLLITEGEANAASARQLLPDLPVVGLPGKTGLEKLLTPALGPESKIWLWLDSGDAGTERATRHAVRTLGQTGVHHVRLINDAGLDANDVLREFPAAIARESLALALEQARSIPTLDHRLRPQPLRTKEAPPTATEIPYQQHSLSVPESSSVLPVYRDRGTPPEKLGYDQEAVREAAKFLGVTVDHPFPCLLHPGAMAMIRRDAETREFLYFPQGGDRSGGIALASLRAALGYGGRRRLTGIEAWCWYSRLFFEAGVLEAFPVALPDLPSWLADDPLVVRVADGFLLHLQLRWRDADHRGQPVAYTREYAAAWSSAVRSQDPQHMAVYRSIDHLVKTGVMRRAGQAGRAHTYLPGESAGSERRVVA